jgi:hypothetical protein
MTAPITVADVKTIFSQNTFVASEWLVLELLSIDFIRSSAQTTISSAFALSYGGAVLYVPWGFPMMLISLSLSVSRDCGLVMGTSLYLFLSLVSNKSVSQSRMAAIGCTYWLAVFVQFDLS